MKQMLLVCLIMFFSKDNIGQTTIVMKRENGVSVVPCKINGLDLSFIFDTGAADVTISLTEALFMLKNGYLSKSDVTGIGKYSDANGTISEGFIINLKSIEFGGIKLIDIKATIVNTLNAPLLLGQSAIKKLGAIQIDLELNTVTILNGKKIIVFSVDKASNPEIMPDVITSTFDENASYLTDKSDPYFNITYSGTVKTVSYAPIYDSPNSVTGRVVYIVQNNKVKIVEKMNNRYYKVKAGGWYGYISVTMIKDKH